MVEEYHNSKVSETKHLEDPKVIELIIDTDLVDTTKMPNKVSPCHFIPCQAIVRTD
jgi:hypothetical protein